MLLTLALAGSLALGSLSPAPGPESTTSAHDASLSGDTLPSAALFRPTASPVSAMNPVPAATGGVAPLDLHTNRAESGTSPDDPPQLIEYSDAYFTRLTIHRWASYLTLPLFVSQYVVGQKLMNGGSDNLRNVHGALASGVGALFVVNTITGGWNAIEARKDPEGKNRRTLHTVLMLLADAGFVATGMMANEREGEGAQYGAYTVNNNNHRNMALASMGTALIGYAIMLPLPIFGRN